MVKDFQKQMLKQDVGIHGDSPFRISFHPLLPAIGEYDRKHITIQKQAAKDPLFQEERPAPTAQEGAEVIGCQVMLTALTVPGIHSSRILDSVCSEGGLSSSEHDVTLRS